MREAVLSKSASPARPDLKALFGGEIPKEILFPEAVYNRDAIQEQKTHELEIDPRKYYPPYVYREPRPDFPKGLKIDTSKLLGPRDAGKK